MVIFKGSSVKESTVKEESWQKVVGEKRKRSINKDSQMKTAREDSESRESEDKMIVVEEATSVYQETNFYIQASREHWMGDLDVLIALSENQPDLKIKTKTPPPGL